MRDYCGIPPSNKRERLTCLPRRESGRIITTVLPCGAKVVAYGLNGARTTCVLLQTGSWDVVFDEAASEWMKPFREVSGHLIEHAAGGVMMGSEVEGLQGHWRGRSVEWMMEGTPGETRSMLRVLPRSFGAAASLTQELLAAEWSRVQLEGRHRRDTGFDTRPVDLVQKLLSGNAPASGGACGQDLQVGLAACPGSAYLSRHLEVLTDQELLAHGDQPASGSQVED